MRWWRWSASRPATSGTCRDSTWRAALDAGWSDAELTETSAVVALNLFTNYFDQLVRICAPGLRFPAGATRRVGVTSSSAKPSCSVPAKHISNR